MEMCATCRSTHKACRICGTIQLAACSLLLPLSLQYFPTTSPHSQWSSAPQQPMTSASPNSQWVTTTLMVAQSFPPPPLPLHQSPTPPLPDRAIDPEVFSCMKSLIKCNKNKYLWQTPQFPCLQLQRSTAFSTNYYV